MLATILASMRTERTVVLKFQKDESIVELLRGLVSNMKLNWGIFAQQDDQTGDVIVEHVTDYVDELISYTDKKVAIDVFVGHKKAILRIHCDPLLLQQFLVFIYQNVRWPALST
jgi:hypothetical protein